MVSRDGLRIKINQSQMKTNLENEKKMYCFSNGNKT